MKWRTDIPTAKLIVAVVNYNIRPEYEILIRQPDGEYANEYYDIPIERIIKWADLEEDDTITENNSLKEEVVSYFQGYWPGTETAEQCNTDMHFTPLAIMRLAEHFSKWGAEHSKK